MKKLGVIADDFTGGTDIASFLVANGLPTTQFNGTPHHLIVPSTGAIVVSLKSRTSPIKQAIADSLNALNWLKQQGCTHFYFKYCSTFDSTPQGNIGPVVDALLKALSDNFTVICPALPINGRTVYNGYLFVFKQLLNESSMRHHPLTPMLDSNLCRLMEQQSTGKAGLIDYTTLVQGLSSIQHRIQELQSQGINYAVLDCLNTQDLDTLASAVYNLSLITGGSGLAGALAKIYATQHSNQTITALWQPHAGKTIILAGSCSAMTLQQIAYYRQKAPHLRLSPDKCLNQADYPAEICHWIQAQQNHHFAPIIYSSDDHENRLNQAKTHDTQQLAQAIEHCFGEIAIQLRNAGFTNFIIAGGETSGCIIQALNIVGFEIGASIAPGVPWVRDLQSNCALALKSGNFGDEKFFETAQQSLRTSTS